MEDLAGSKHFADPKLRGSHHSSPLHSDLCRAVGTLTKVIGFWT